MSYDLDVFLTSDVFPEAAFTALLSDLGVTREDESDRFGRHWTTTIEPSAVFTSVRELSGEHLFGYERGYKWSIGVYANSGCPPQTRWAQFAIPFRCLTLLTGAIAYDPQTGAFFDDPISYRNFAGVAIPRWSGLPRQMRHLGVMSDDGVPKF
ncbi:hypothetical protein SAMN06265222_104294 [Neorhodopirellula lusitana]|uniref:Uncharacterized protein n=1 Tax=Neorhodopirellula lusitana TaxID=445327 RepID=A0ABY1Q073_9BACT|nr:hypothetical protein [Neorhodopirellula lusitana]SMP54784.1 hypothetical protein SAMN06265222_104294 [Neorhodopirellula lusitana]